MTNGSAAAAATPNHTTGGSSSADASEAARQIDDVRTQRRVRRQLAGHSVRDRDEERGDRGKKQRQQQRALDGDDWRGRPARKVDRRSGGKRHLETQTIDRRDQRGERQWKPQRDVPPASGEQAPEADAEKA